MKTFSFWTILLLSCTIALTATEETGIKIRTFEDQPDEVTVYLNFQALIGTKIQLPCNASLPSSDDSISLILWYKNDRKSAPIYSIDARNGPIEKAKHFVAKSIKNRAQVFLHFRPTLLEIEPLVKEDEGTYVCRVDFKWARTINTVSNLTVITSPKHVLIKDDQNNNLVNVIGPFDEGSSLKLVCQCYEGNPPPALIWLKDGIVVDETYSFVNKSNKNPQDSSSSSSSSFTFNELELTNLGRKDLFSVYMCQASNNNISSPVSSSVILDINFKPLKVEILTSKKALLAESSVELTCRSKFSRPAATINWYLNSKNITFLSREKVSEDGNITTSVIKFVPQINDNGADLICEADIQSQKNISKTDKNFEKSRLVVRDTWKLNISYAPNVTLNLMNNRLLRNTSSNYLKSSNNTYLVQEGDEVSFNCIIDANPEATLIQWLLNGEPIETDSNVLIIQKSYLHIKSVQKKHKAKYKCLAANSEGNKISNEIDLQILSLPVCDNKPVENNFKLPASLNEHYKDLKPSVTYSIKLGETANISCKVDANPMNVSFYWAFNKTETPLSSLNNQQDELNNYEQIDQSLESLLLYTPMTKDDYGYLACWAENAIGYQRVPCLFNIIPSDSVDELKSCFIANQTWNFLFIECKNDEKIWNQDIFNSNENDLHLNLSTLVYQYPQIKYYLEVYNFEKTRLLFNLSNSNPQFGVSGLAPSTSYIFKIYSSNSKTSDHSLELVGKTITMLTRKQDYLQSETFKHSQTLFIIFGFILFLLLFLLIFLIILKIRKRDETNLKKKPSLDNILSKKENQEFDKAIVKSDDQSLTFNHNNQQFYQMVPVILFNNPDVIPINPELLSNNTGNCSNLISNKLTNFSPIEALHEAIVVSELDAIKQNIHLNPHVMVIDDQPLIQSGFSFSDNPYNEYLMDQQKVSLSTES